MEIPPREWHIIWHKACVVTSKQVSWMFISQHSFFPYLAEMMCLAQWLLTLTYILKVTQLWRCLFHGLYSWHLLCLWHKYNPWGDDHFSVNRSKDNVTRAIRIFAVETRGILTLVDQDLQFLVIFRVTGPLCEEFTGHQWIPLTKASDAKLWCFLWSAPEQTVE